MSVTGPSYNINAIQKLSETELRQGFSSAASWHNKYKDSCYIFIGGLPFRMNEGDLATVFSQWGEVVDIHLVRDKKTGVSRGFAFVGYENQKSTILAVDNFNGYELLGRRLRIDHCASFRAAKDRQDGSPSEAYRPSGAEGAGYGVHAVTTTMRKIIECQKTAPPAAEASSTVLDADEKWAAEFEAMLTSTSDTEINDGPPDTVDTTMTRRASPTDHDDTAPQQRRTFPTPPRTAHKEPQRSFHSRTNETFLRTRSRSRSTERQHRRYPYQRHREDSFYSNESRSAPSSSDANRHDAGRRPIVGTRYKHSPSTSSTRRHAYEPAACRSSSRVSVTARKERPAYSSLSRSPHSRNRR